MAIKNLGKVSYAEVIKGVVDGEFDLPLPHELREAEASGLIRVDRNSYTWVKMPGTGMTGILLGETVSAKPETLTFQANLFAVVPDQSQSSE